MFLKFSNSRNPLHIAVFLLLYKFCDRFSVNFSLIFSAILEIHPGFWIILLRLATSFEKFQKYIILLMGKFAGIILYLNRFLTNQTFYKVSFLTFFLGKWIFERENVEIFEKIFHFRIFNSQIREGGTRLPLSPEAPAKVYDSLFLAVALPLLEKILAIRQTIIMDFQINYHILDQDLLFCRMGSKCQILSENLCQSLDQSQISASVLKTVISLYAQNVSRLTFR